MTSSHGCLTQQLCFHGSLTHSYTHDQSMMTSKLRLIGLSCNLKNVENAIKVDDSHCGRPICNDELTKTFLLPLIQLALQVNLIQHKRQRSGGFNKIQTAVCFASYPENERDHTYVMLCIDMCKSYQLEDITLCGMSAQYFKQLFGVGRLISRKYNRKKLLYFFTLFHTKPKLTAYMGYKFI